MTEPTNGLASRQPGYLLRHWRGDLSLGVAFWINGAALSALLAIAIYYAYEANFVKMLSAYQLFIFVVFILVIIFLFSVWQLVGIWLSAAKHADRGGGRLPARITQVLIMIFWGLWLQDVNRTIVPAMREIWRAATFGDLSAPARIEPTQDGSAISFVGGIPPGTAARLEQVLSGAPNARTLRLHSPGGYTADSWTMGALVWRSGLDTYVEGECSSACAIVFLAGRQRILRQGGRIGFHRPRLVEAGPDAERLLADERRRIERTVLPAWFVARIFETPPEILWYPSIDELRSANVVTTVVSARDHPRPDQEPASP